VDLVGKVLLYESHTYLIIRLLPHSQPSVFMDMPVQNMFNLANDYKVTLHLI